MTARLRSVPTIDEPVDIGRLMRADRLDADRWARVHCEADKRRPLDLPDRPRRLWRG